MIRSADIEVLQEVEMALHDAYESSSRKSKWSTVADVKAFSGKANLSTLRELVDSGGATEKTSGGIHMQQFKPSRGLAGSGDSKTSFSSRSSQGRNGQEDRGEQDQDDDQRDEQEQDEQEQGGGKPPPWGEGKPWDDGIPWWPWDENGEPMYKGKSDRDKLGNTMGTGVGLMIAGGMGSSSAAAGTGTSAATGAASAVPSMPVQPLT